MSQQTVELVRAAFRSWYPNDSEAFAATLHPEFEYRVAYGPERGVHRGWEATVEAFDQWQAVFSEYSWEATEFIDAGEGQVVVPFSEQGTGIASGIEIAQRSAFLCTVRDGLMLRLVEYQTTAEALAAANAPD